MSLPATSSYNRVSVKPIWLDAELAHAKKLMPSIDLHVMFSDELPHTDEMLMLDEQPSLTDRQRGRMRNIARIRFKALNVALTERFSSRKLGRYFTENAYRTHPSLILSMCFSDLRFGLQPIVNNCGESFQRIATEPPTTAFMLLAPRSFDSVSMMAYMTGLKVEDAIHAEPHTPHITSMAHERGHLETALSLRPTIMWIDEFASDRTALNHSHKIKRPDLASRFLLGRAATNFLGDIEEGAATYWNVLSLQGQLPYSTEGILRDKSSILELKRRAARWFENVDCMRAMRGNEFTRFNNMMYSPHHAGLRDMFSSNQPYAALERKVLMHALDRVVEQDVYTYPETRYLAQITQQALHTYFPSVLADKAYYSRYLKGNAPAP